MTWRERWGQTAERAAFPSVPTIAESCAPGFELKNWYAKYPTKPMRVLSSSIQGGGTDVVARMVAQGIRLLRTARQPCRGYFLSEPVDVRT